MFVSPSSILIRLLFCTCLLFLIFIALSSAESVSAYWEWGYGIYGGDGILPDSTMAKYQWSTINFGNISTNQATIDRLNRILAINPNHKFLIRVWPILGLGDNLEENRYQATLFHYFYKSGTKSAIFNTISSQVHLVMDNLTNPNAVVGVVFLEELPYHFTGITSIPSSGQPSWDLIKFSSQITAELGQPFDLNNSQHRIWWGQKYSQAMKEICTQMRSASGGKPAFYWQQANYDTLDTKSGTFSDRVLPIHLADIVTSDGCDGFFGYPINNSNWQTNTINLANITQGKFFSQISYPDFMRGTSFVHMAELAHQNHPNNLGAFFYFEPMENNLAVQIADQYIHVSSPPPTPNPTPTPSPTPSCLGDINQDTQVNLADFLLLLQDFLKPNPNSPADINSDGLVNLSDFLIFKANFLQPCN